MREIITGVYKITNMINDKYYIGSSDDIYKRWHSHKYYLDNNKHINKHLQNAWNKYGEENFEFEIIEKCNHKNKFIREQYYLDKLNPFDKSGYNICKQANGGMNGSIPEGIIAEIKSMFKYGYKTIEISKNFNIDKRSIESIRILDSYSNIAVEYNKYLDNGKKLRKINNNTIIRFGITLDELICKKDKTKEEMRFYRDINIVLFN